MGTGPRRSEMCGLAWADLGLKSEVLAMTVRRGLHRDRHGLYVGEPKSAASARTVSIDDKTATMLHDLADERTTGRALKDPIDGLNEPFDPVFRWGEGQRADETGRACVLVRKEWSHASLRPGVTLHGLRHSHGSTRCSTKSPSPTAECTPTGAGSG